MKTRRTSLVVHLKKINFDDVPMAGSEKEEDQLRGMVQRAREIGQTPQLVTIAGYSGVGKSTLMTEVGKYALGEEGQESAYFGWGKEQSQVVPQPFEALTEGMSMLVSQVKERGNMEGERIQRGLEESFQNDPLLIVMLLETISDLGAIVELPEGISLVDEGVEVHLDFRFRRLCLAFAKFLRVVASPETPLIIAVDDVQWSSQVSLDLLESILLDEKIEGLIVIATYRDNEEVMPGGALSTFLKIQKIKLISNMTSIALGTLGIDDLNTLVAHVVGRDEKSSLELSETLFAKTQGNPFFSFQMMQSLFRAGHIYYDMKLFGFQWDLDAIVCEASLSTNVVDLVTEKLRTLDNTSHRMLMISACLGSRFDRNVVEGVYKESGYQNSPTFDELIAERIIVCGRRNGSVYSFTHDRLHEAAYALFGSNDERDKTHFRIGQYMLSKNGGGLEQQVESLVLTEQLNRGIKWLKSDEELEELAARNNKAGLIAVKKSAFLLAASFFRHRIDLLPKGKCWDDRLYRLTLGIHSSLIESLYTLGEYKECDLLITIVLENARTRSDAHRASRTKINALFTRGRIAETLDVGICALRGGGMKLPRKAKKYQVILEFFAIKRLVKKISMEEFVYTKECASFELKQDFLIMTRLIMAAYLGNELNLLFLLNLRCLKLSLRHGPSKFTAQSLVTYGVFLAGMGDFATAHKMGIVVDQLVNRFQARELNASTQSWMCACLRPLRGSLHELLDRMLKAHKDGIETGDMVSGCTCAVVYVEVYFFSGLPLLPVTKDGLAVRSEFLKSGQDAIRFVLDVFVQGTLCISGQSEDPFVLSGEAMHEHIDVARAKKEKNVVGFHGFLFMKLCLAYLLEPAGDRTAAAAKALWAEPNPFDGSPNYAVIPFSFYSAMAAMAISQTTTKRKYRKIWIKNTKTVEQWEKRGVPWISHLVALLHAERDRTLMKKEASEIKSGYDSAIRLAARGGFVNDCALANERCALFFKSIGDGDWFAHYRQKSLTLYKEWGAIAKLNILTTTEVESSEIVSAEWIRGSRHGTTISLHSGHSSLGHSGGLQSAHSQHSSGRSSAFRGRERFGKGTSIKHKATVSDLLAEDRQS
jgi:predicted ATPase